MKLVHNISDWIPPWLINYLLDPAAGQSSPTINKEWKSSSSIAEFWTSNGYDLKKIHLRFFNEEDIPKRLLLPDFFNNPIEYWFSKLDIGTVFPLHRDTYKYDHDSIDRYWIALEDWQPGHIFQCGSTVLCNYSKGDVFLFDSPKELHGAANFGLQAKISMQISCLK